jgi:hypothetical protein
MGVTALAILSVTSCTNSGTFIGADNSHIRYVGRFDLSTPSAPRMAWAGSQIVATFEGSSCSAIIQDSCGKDSVSGCSGNSGDDYQYYDVYIDGALAKTFFAPSKQDTFVLASGLANATHRLTLLRRTESQRWAATFRGLILDNGKGLVSPDPASSRRIEYIGDSHTVGTGVECYTNGQWGWDAPGPHNVAKSYATLTSRYFGADNHITAMAGKGLVHNHSDVKMASDTTIRHYFRRTLQSAILPAWNPATWIPQVVVLNIGTNDFAEWRQASWGQKLPGDSLRKPATAAVFVPAYRAFLDTIRSVYPGVKIVCVGPYDWCGGLDSAAKVIRTAFDQEIASGEHDVYWLPYPSSQTSDFVCCHPGVAFHRKIADSLEVVISTIPGWGTTSAVAGAPDGDRGMSRPQVVGTAGDASRFDLLGRQARDLTARGVYLVRGVLANGTRRMVQVVARY